MNYIDYFEGHLLRCVIHQAASEQSDLIADVLKAVNMGRIFLQGPCCDC